MQRMKFKPVLRASHDFAPKSKRRFRANFEIGVEKKIDTPKKAMSDAHTIAFDGPVGPKWNESNVRKKWWNVMDLSIPPLSALFPLLFALLFLLCCGVGLKWAGEWWKAREGEWSSYALEQNYRFWRRTKNKHNVPRENWFLQQKNKQQQLQTLVAHFFSSALAYCCLNGGHSWL